MKSKIGVSSFSNGSGFGIAKVGDGYSKDLGSVIWDSSSNGFSTTSSVMFSKIFVRMLLPTLAEACKNEPPEAVLRSFDVSYQEPYKSVEEE